MNEKDKTNADPFRFMNAKTYTRADLDRAAQEARAATFREAANTAMAMAAGETYETGRQKALNIAAALEAAANSVDSEKKDAPKA